MEEDIIKNIEEKRKIPIDAKEKIIAEVFDCTLSAIIMYVYFIFLKLGARNIFLNLYVKDLKVFSVSLAVLSIVFIEGAYNKKDAKRLCRGIEILILAIITMFIQYIVVYLLPKYRVMIIVFAIVYNIYFVLKALLLIYNIKRKHMKKLSDVKEIVTKEKKK